MNALTMDCWEGPLKFTSNEIKRMSHFKLWSKLILATRHNPHVPEPCCCLHAQCTVVPAAVLFQTTEQVF